MWRRRSKIIRQRRARVDNIAAHLSAPVGYRGARTEAADPQQRRNTPLRHARPFIHSAGAWAGAPGWTPGRCGMTRIRATIAAARIAVAVKRLKANPPWAMGLSSRSPSVAP